MSGNVAAIEPPVRWDIVQEHLAEAEFLGEQLVAAMDSHGYRIDEVVSGPYERFAAHVDALAVGGAAVAERSLYPTLHDEEAEAGTRTAAALGALTSTHPAAAERMLGDYAAASQGAQLAIADALVLWDAPRATFRLQTLLASTPLELCAPLFAACARRAMDPGAPLEAALRSGDPALAAAAASAAMYAPKALLTSVEWSLQFDDERLLPAVSAGLVMGSPHAWNTATHLARDKAASHRTAMAHVATLDGITATGIFVARLDDAAARPDALWALGYCGTLEAAEACLGWLADADVGPLAGEAFATITGLPMDEEGCWLDAPTEAGQDPAPGSDDEDDLPDLDDDLATDLMPGDDDDLPQPVPEAIAAWWRARRGAFRSGQRYVLGRAADEGSLRRALGLESTRRRHERAFEILARTRGACIVPTWRTPTSQVQLTSALSLPRIDGNRAFSRIS